MNILCTEESLSGAWSASGSCLNWSRLTPVTVIKISEQETTDADQRLIFFLHSLRAGFQVWSTLRTTMLNVVLGSCAVGFSLFVLFGFKLAITGH